MLTCWKIAPCIAAGNTLIIKPPELAPLSSLHLAKLIDEAGFPPGVINIIPGLGSQAGSALAHHMKVRKIAFTGSTLTGRAILKASAESNLKKVSLELGGKSPAIIFDDADFEEAVMWAMIGITAGEGEICAAGSRIYVQDTIYEKFLKAFSDQCKKAVSGDPMASGTSKGPLISDQQREKVSRYIEEAKAKGTPLLHGGNRIGRSNAIENTAFFDVPEDSAIMKEEIFGPVAVSTRHKNHAFLARARPYGSGADANYLSICSPLPNFMTRKKSSTRPTTPSMGYLPLSLPRILLVRIGLRIASKADRSPSMHGLCWRLTCRSEVSQPCSPMITFGASPTSQSY